MDTSLATEIKQYLESINTCKRCILRFLGKNEYTLYTTKTSVSEALEECMGMQKSTRNGENGNETDSVVNGYPSPKRLAASPCVSCLGILQDSCDDMVLKVQQVVSENGHEFEDFVLQLSVPVVLDLRDRLFLLHLMEKFKDSYKYGECDIPSVKDVWKWVVGLQFGRNTKSDFVPNSDFQICISITYPNTSVECLPLFETYPEAFPNRKKKKATVEDIYTRTAVLKALEYTSDIKRMFSFPPPAPDSNCIYKIDCQHSAIYLGGRYNKYSRELPQTSWIVDGERRMESSVNELITDVIQKRVLCDKIIFSSSGREDVDVKMLGNGRPFVLEILNPKKIKWSHEEIKQIENEINENSKLIFIRNLQIITKKDTLLLKEGEEEKRKCYSALCIVGKTLTDDDIKHLNSLKDIKLCQKTPIRVLHRRTLATREKILHSLSAESLTNNQLRVHLETQAGTYVKEFVHGDFGRTIPNLGSLLDTTADILELDVESIELEWPPQSS